MGMMNKKICFVVSTPMTVNAFLRNHIKELAKEYRVHLVANMENFSGNIFQGLPISEIHDIKIKRNINLYKDLIAIHHLTKLFKIQKFEVVHSVTPKAGLLAMIAAKRAKIKNRIHIFTGQVWHTKTGIFKKFLMNIDKIIVHCATKILVDGKSQRTFLINHHILKATNSQVLGLGSISGVEVSRFRPDETKRKKLRKELHYSNNDVVFSFLGRLNQDKGIKELALAFNFLVNKYPNARLLLIGSDEGNMRDYLTKIISKNQFISFYGETKKPEEILQVSDVFCLPSYREGFGTSVLEASLLGIPVICSDTYGLKETMIDEITGLRHEVKNVESLFSAMEILYLSAEKRTQFGKAGREYVLQNFTAEKITNVWLSFYRDLLK